jgi:hypothetical protein
VSEIGTPITDFTEAGTLDGTEIVPLVRPGLNVRSTLDDILALSSTPGYSVVPFTQSVLTDQTATMTAAIDGLPADGGVVLIPGGTFYSRIEIDSATGLTFRGAGALATTLVKPTSDTQITTPVVAATPAGDGRYTFEDMTFDLSIGGSGAMVTYAHDHDVTFRRCRFINITSYAVTCNGSVGTTFEDCEFDDGATATGLAVQCNHGTRGLRWIRSKVRFMDSGISFDISPHDDIDIDGGLFDGGWYLLPTRTGGYTNSGGTVTYSATVLTDSAASFATLDTPFLVDVRALLPLESGSTGTTYLFRYVNDAAATFVTNVVRPGHIVRTADKWGVVAHVVSETRLYVEEWFDSTTYRPTEPPAAADAYTVYRVLTGTVVSNTATTITVTRWSDFYDGTVETPSAGTLYEVMINHGGYTGIHAAATTPQAAGAIKRIRVHGGCHITRCWNDQLSIYGVDSRLVVDPTVLIDHGQDYGITYHGDQGRIYGTVIHNGAVGIYTSGQDCTISAFASGSPYINPTDSYLGDILISGSRTRVSGSVVVASGAWARYGIVVAGPPVHAGDVDAVDLTGASASGYSVAEYSLYSLTSPTVTVTDTVARDVTGVIIEDGASGTINPVSTSEQQTTVGAAGGASALPATPTKYIKVTVDGTDYVFPAYAVS